MAAAAPPTSNPAPLPATPPAPDSPVRPQAREVRDLGTVRRDSVEAERWTARGTVKVTGNVQIGDGALDGNVSIGGKVTASSLRVQGMIDVEGAVDVSGALTSRGDLRTATILHVGEADLRGTIRVLGSVSVDRSIVVRGSLSAPALTAQGVTIQGAAEVPGDLVARAVSARLGSDSAFGTIRAPSVSLRAKIPNLVEKVLGRRITVTAKRIEADNVELEAVNVAFVRAPKISLGREAHITEYEGTIVKRHPTSRVGFESKSPPPYGLSR